MTATVIESRLRAFLLILVLMTLLATLTELVLEEHTQEALQYIPFVLCGIGLVSVIAALLKPERATLMALRWVMAFVGLGGILGIALHLIRNLEFEQEIQPNAAVSDLLVKTLKGANPLLAPGVMVFAALIAIAATYYHPALGKRTP